MVTVEKRLMIYTVVSCLVGLVGVFDAETHHPHGPAAAHARTIPMWCVLEDSTERDL
jgi:hypothetical protein